MIDGVPEFVRSLSPRHATHECPYGRVCLCAREVTRDFREAFQTSQEAPCFVVEGYHTLGGIYSYVKCF